MKFTVLLLLVVLSASCAKQGSAPIDYSQYFSKFKKTVSQNNKLYYHNLKVKKGDTLYNLAKKYEVLRKDIVLLNNLKAPYNLNAGKILKIPLKYHKINPKDTLYKISKKYGVKMDYIATANRLSKPYKLEIGQLLRIPANNKEDLYAYTTKDIKQSKYSKIVYSPKKYNPVKKVAAKKKATTKKKIVKKPQSNIKSKIATPKANKKFVKYAKPLAKTGKNSGRFYWPTKGAIISKFGAQKGGVQNDGINIATKKGAKIIAADAGTVVFASNELRGYGNLIIIKHNSGWLTAYAHQKNFIVRNGQKVKKGQVIGYVGDTGNVTQPQLHFAMRKNGKSINPLKYLKI